MRLAYDYAQRFAAWAYSPDGGGERRMALEQANAKLTEALADALRQSPAPQNHEQLLPELVYRCLWCDGDVVHVRNAGDDGPWEPGERDAVRQAFVAHYRGCQSFKDAAAQSLGAPLGETEKENT